MKNVLLGCSILFWTVREGVRWAAWPGIVPASIAMLNVVAGSLLCLRSPARNVSSLGVWLQSLPCVVWGVLIFHLIPKEALWPVWGSVGFAVASLWTSISLLTLGSSFAVFPAWRGLVDFGPYRLVRHPAYLGECLMAAAASAALRWEFALPLCALMLVFVCWRIRVEEHLLAQQPEYRAYRGQVRWRLLPGVW